MRLLRIQMAEISCTVQGYSYYSIAQRPLTCGCVSICSLSKMSLAATWAIQCGVAVLCR